jgi:hypothetical protein
MQAAADKTVALAPRVRRRPAPGDSDNQSAEVVACKKPSSGSTAKSGCPCETAAGLANTLHLGGVDLDRGMAFQHKKGGAR